MPSSYATNLKSAVLQKSESNIWDDAVLEWRVSGWEEDPTLSESCICGKENLRYLFEIENEQNGEILFPIGSSCINKFGRRDLTETVRTQESFFKLLHALEDSRFIKLTSEFFTRKLLKALYEQGAFASNEHNRNNPKNDYAFMLDMFNIKDKDNISPRQQSKINAIIIAQIIPFLRERSGRNASCI